MHVDQDAVAPSRSAQAPRSRDGIVLAGALLVASLSALSLSRHPPPYGFEFAVGLGLLGVVALAVVRLEAAAFLGLALLGIVIVDPAPADFVLARGPRRDVRHRQVSSERASGCARWPSEDSWH